MSSKSLFVDGVSVGMTCFQEFLCVSLFVLSKMDGCVVPKWWPSSSVCKDTSDRGSCLLVDIYQQVATDLTPQLENRITASLIKLQKSGELNKRLFQKMKPDGSNTPRFYGLPKIHKPGAPLRPIVSLPGTPTYRLAKELHQRLKHRVEDSRHSIHSSQEFLNTIKSTKIEEDETMVSFDVTALFTSININLAKETLTTLVEEPKTHTPDTTNLISKDKIIKLVDLCLTTHFTFNNKTYRQTNGTPMGSPTSGFLAEGVVQRLEQTALPIIQPKLWVCYVDDTFVITKRNKLEETFKTINNILPDVKFTKEEEHNNKLHS
ncbi:uncharacterized protein LOC132207173 isoform X1 [Stegostoma tigrinum]|uniref:uncharacterized protein LOC132206965 n=1 Tax=Stegostoma tigrinum TaxID=3053191 RepID=UPI00286FD883|nr:uncharacterized protein LOC132206965 [Stegostoma tigrinum]XP_059498081.1 uncharacterized protein LOC132206965 [Stegostoma tigrinum]XP_059498082.1 uncharacterized protein LOC132206965 [Stegostoma tigrinum]XP_059498083.1 uncharacterized protein LOC132206965 [Stegostoma tigrinum]XP_059498354.1 uncharacterized protein LOC132207172 [Stegostoma tigrinum]XP_059498355.1 uncharacterized protein LOC132207172 [Stegostoma tigrinum]XP_059498356.1 uncharacterized protein LOC132207172 [Stegostoma tigrinu